VEFGRAGYDARSGSISTPEGQRDQRGAVLHRRRAHRARGGAQGSESAARDDEFEALAEVDTINICVPTPLRKTKDPDMSYIVSAAEEIAKRLRPGQLIILESTTYPGTTDELVLPMLEKGGSRAARTSSWRSRPSASTRRTVVQHAQHPKVIGGMTEDCTRSPRRSTTARSRRSCR
jgi:UDP-N-acetyl-D-glucosamine dehydrogenase